MSSSVFIIDIQQDQISCVLLNQGLKGIRVEQTECRPLVQVPGDETSLPAIKAVLTPLLESMGQEYDRCVIGIPAGYFFFRTLDLPFKNRKKISQILSFELERYLPWPVEAVESDFCLLPKNSKGAFEKNMAGVVSIQTEHLEQFKSLFDACRVHPDVITVGSGHGAALFYAGAADPTVFCLFVHVERLLAAVHVVRSGEIAFTRTVLLDAETPVKTVTTTLIHTVLSFNDVFTSPLELKDVVVSGTASFLQELMDEIERELTVRVVAFDIFTFDRLTPPSDPLLAYPYPAVQNAVAMGVNETKGVETFNFIRHVSDMTLFYQDNKFSILAVAVLSLLVFLAWAVNPMIEMRRMERNIQQLDSQVTQVFQSCFPEVTQIVDPVHQMQLKVMALKEKKNLNFFDNYPLCIDVLNEVSKSLPPSLDIVFSRFVRTENTLIVSGSAEQFNTIDKMKNHFNNIALFKEVEIHSASMDKADKRVTFNLKIIL